MLEQILSYVSIAIGAVMIFYFFVRYIVVLAHFLWEALKWSVRIFHILLLSFHALCFILVGIGTLGILPIDGVGTALSFVALPLCLVIILRCAFASEDRRPVLFTIGAHSLPAAVLYILNVIPYLFK